MTDCRLRLDYAQIPRKDKNFMAKITTLVQLIELLLLILLFLLVQKAEGKRPTGRLGKYRAL